MPVTPWSQEDPREAFRDVEHLRIVVVSGLEAWVGVVHTHDGWAVFMQGREPVGDYESWPPGLWWTTAPEDA
jgi:hypothetical protein